MKYYSPKARDRNALIQAAIARQAYLRGVRDAQRGYLPKHKTDPDYMQGYTEEQR